MKNLVLVGLLSLAVGMPVTASAEAVVKEVCKVKKVDGKEQKVCKKLKTHKKLDGKKVPAK